MNYQPGDKFAVDIELVRLVNDGEQVTLQNNHTLQLDNKRQNKWWARTIPGSDDSLVLVVVDPTPPTPQSLHEFRDNAEKLLTVAFEVRNQLTHMAQAMDDARDAYYALLRKYHMKQPPL